MDLSEMPPPGFSTIHDAVIADVQTRQAHGQRVYGRPHRLFNGRDSLQEAYEEALDLVFWLRQDIEERKAAAPVIAAQERERIRQLALAEADDNSMWSPALTWLAERLKGGE